MKTSQKHSVIGDRALSSGDKDRLGFREAAHQIVTSLVDRSSEDGLVVGLEGAWGAGKSSLLFLIRDEVDTIPADRRPTIINFRPWLISDRDALIGGLFGEFAQCLDQMALEVSRLPRISVAKAKNAGEKLRRFMHAVSKAGEVITVVGESLEMGSVKLAGKIVKATGDLTGGKATPPALSDLKDKLVASLRDLGHRFIVTIDDVDRLDPPEVIEVLRLVRSVVDLPNVIYLLCYDREILAHSIEQAVGVKFGQAYLEKIVQIIVMVPKAETFQLRQWFADELHQLASAKDDDEFARLKAVVDYDGGRYLRTPRSVIRVLDAVRFLWPPLRDAKADLADFIWLQFIKNDSPALYGWIEEYCATAAVVSLGVAHVGQEEKDRTIAALMRTVLIDHFSDLSHRHNFVEILPGVNPDHREGKISVSIFEHVKDGDRNAAIRKRRLASPDHYRLYFALTGPSYALTQEDLISLFTALGDGAIQAGRQILRFHEEKITESFTKADLLLERIGSGHYGMSKPAECENLLIALSLVMDDAYRRHPFDLFELDTSWDRAERLIRPLLSRQASQNRIVLIEQIFRDGSSVGWLTSLLRREIAAHGRFGYRPQSEGEWSFREDELDRIVEFMLGRYRLMPFSEIIASVRPIGILIAWGDVGSYDEVRKRLECFIVRDDNFIEALKHLTTKVDSSNRGRYEVLKKEIVSKFLFYDDVETRIRALTTHDSLGERAKHLLVALEDGAELSF